MTKQDTLITPEMVVVAKRALEDADPFLGGTIYDKEVRAALEAAAPLIAEEVKERIASKLETRALHKPTIAAQQSYKLFARRIHTLNVTEGE